MEKCLRRFSAIKKTLLFLTIFLLAGAGLLSAGFGRNYPDTPERQTETLGFEGERAFAVKVIDGDTLELIDGRTVRLLGIDTPETVDPRRPVGCFGKQASAETKELLSGKEIIMQKDVSDTDKYGRLLRLIYLPLSDGQILFVNDYLVRMGFAAVLTYPPDVKYDKQLREAEVQAKEEKRGLWGFCEGMIH